MKTKPNILFLFADQFRADALGVVSSYYSTPHLDRITEEGVLFRRAYCNSPECIPSRFCLALSQYPHQTGVWRNRPITLNPACANWMQAVAQAGHRTSLFGKTHLHPHNGDLRERESFMQELGLVDVDEIAGPRASMNCLSHMTAGWRENGLWERYRRDFEERFATTPYLVRPSALPLADYYDVYVGRSAARYLTEYRDDRPWCCWPRWKVEFAPDLSPVSAFDLETDPAEQQNLIAEFADAQMWKGLLDEMLARTPTSPPPATIELFAERRGTPSSGGGGPNDLASSANHD